MALKLFSADDVLNKLHNTICLYKGVPYQVQIDTLLLNNDKVMLYSLLDPGKLEIVKYTSDDFDYSCTPLGWFRDEERALYISRLPGRYNNLGLLRTNLDEALSSNSFYSKYMYACILAKHPSYKEALKSIWNDKVGTIPFHRHAALQRIDANNAEIRYINKTISILSRDGRKFRMMSGNDSLGLKLLQRIGVTDV